MYMYGHLQYYCAISELQYVLCNIAINTANIEEVKLHVCTYSP